MTGADYSGSSPIVAGELDRLALLQAPVPATVATSDANAEPGDDWTTVAKVWVGIRPLTGEQRLLAKQVVASATHEIRMRWRPDVTSRQRFVYQGRLLYIREPPREIGRRAGLEMLAGEEEAK